MPLEIAWLSLQRSGSWSTFRRGAICSSFGCCSLLLENCLRKWYMMAQHCWISALRRCGTNQLSTGSWTFFFQGKSWDSSDYTLQVWTTDHAPAKAALHSFKVTSGKVISVAFLLCRPAAGFNIFLAAFLSFLCSVGVLLSPLGDT
jgi:hypothetical protein